MAGYGGNGRNVVSMMGRETDQRSAPLREVEAYWTALCGTDTLPLRSQIDPRGIEGALEYAFLAERISPRLAKLRVAGSHLSDLMGMQVAGMPVSALFTPKDRDRLAEAVEALFARPAVLHLQLQAAGGFGRSGLDGTMLLMPLLSDFGEVSRALGCLVTQGRIGRTPRRFDIAAIDLRCAFSDDHQRPLGPDMSERLQKAPIRHLSEDRAPFAPAATGRAPAKGKAPHLRLVASNDD
ncbi:PAS domain-containing protein [Thalassococcus sp. BH17M4-6]|uniref:PAS domain-containing protein n=1 Tax=Thalassococcus sp. BH17M4-6 TaxID=3413148 RepID=UPI003BC78DF7